MLTDLEKEILQKTIWDNPYIPKDHMPFPKQLDALLDFRKELLFGGSAGGGKLIYTKTPIYTNMGLTTIDQLKVGDTVFDENGKQCFVLAVSDIEYNKDCYKLTFSDGSKIIAADTHLWPAVSMEEEIKRIRRTPEFRAKRRAIRPKRGTGAKPWLGDMNSRRAYNYLPPLEIRNKTTKELYDTQQVRGRTNYYIPVCKPLRYSKKELALDPYVLGCWLGDGTKGTSGITGVDDEIFDIIEKRGFKITHYSYKRHNISGLITKIKEIGCYRDKHIPEEYFTSSVKQRVDLLRGLADTDGYATKSGACEIQLTRKELIDDVSRLLHSLGIKHEVHEGDAKLYGRVTSKKWRIKFFTNIKVFNLKRKAERQKKRDLRPTTFRRYIEKIEKVESVPTQCIKVSSLSGQYLVGESLIPTHNSDYLLMAALQFVEQPNYNAIIFRRTYSDLSLPEGLIPRSHEWLTHTPAQYKQDLHQWLFPSGSTLTFGYLESESHIYRYKCFHEDTEILTKDGWKWIRHIKMNENVATLNPTTRELEYHPVTNTYQYDYDGDLIEFYGRNSVSFAVTPNHKILYSTVDVSDLRQTEVTKLPINAKIPQYAKHFNGITPTDITFTSDGANGKSITFTPTQFAKFLGWFLSEGNLYKKRYSITITQCNEYGRKIIRELLTEIGMNFWVNDKSFRFSNKALCAYLEQFGKCRDKFIPRDVMEWSSTLLEELLYALIEGDGTWIEPGYRGHFVTMSKQLADDISEIAIKCGYRPTIALRYTGNPEDSPFKNDMCYHVAVVKKNADTRIQTCKKTTLPYKGKIYCVEVKPYHNILIRYRGRVCFIGQSAAFSFIGFEELTEFPIERFYTYLFSRMRKPTDSKIPLRMRATTNPDGPGAEWVYERFKPDDPQPLENGRRFLSSKLYDNPHIDQESYIANLEETDPVTRMQLQEGVWRVKKSGNKFKQEWFDRCYINEEDVPEEGITVRYWDLAATELKPGTRTNNDPDYTVGAKIRLYHNVYYIMDIRRDRLSPGKLEEYIQETAEFDGPETIIYLEQEPGSSGKIMTDDYIRRVLSGYAAFSDRPTGPKEARANVFSAALYNGMVRLVRAPWNKSFVTECCLFPTKGVHDDMVDSVSSGIGRLPRAKRWKTGNIGEISTFNPMAQDMIFDTGDLKIEDDGIEEFF